MLSCMLQYGRHFHFLDTHNVTSELLLEYFPIFIICMRRCVYHYVRISQYCNRRRVSLSFSFSLSDDDILMSVLIICFFGCWKQTSSTPWDRRSRTQYKPSHVILIESRDVDWHVSGTPRVGSRDQYTGGTSSYGALGHVPPPSTSNCFIFHVTSEAHKLLSLWHWTQCRCLCPEEKNIQTIIAQSPFIVWIS